MLVRAIEYFDHRGKGYSTHDQNVHVADLALFPLGNGTEDEGHVDFFNQRVESFTQHICQAQRLPEDRSKILENRALSISLIVHLIARLLSHQ